MTTDRKRAGIADMRGIIGVLALAALGACTNPDVPAGHEGYIHHVPLIFGKMEYRESLAGPASTSVSWRLYTINIDMRENTYREEFKLLSSDDLKVSFEVSTRIRLRPGTAREIVEVWGAGQWYERNVKEPLRTIVRREIMRVSATNIQSQTEVVGRRIEEALLEKYKGTPIMFQSVDVGQFEFPEEVTKAIQQKTAKGQELDRQQFILEKTGKEAAIRVLDALRLARKQQIISATLDPLYVQWRAVQVYRALAESPNKTVIMLPNSPEGTGLPQVLTDGKRKVLSADDEAYLNEVEVRYMKMLAPPPEPPGGGSEASPAGAAVPAADGAAAGSVSPAPAK